MKICVTSEGKSLQDNIDPRFGRCSYFLIVNPETGAYESLPNPHRDSTGGAGIQSAQYVYSQGVEAVLTGNIGPNAMMTFSEAGITVYTGVSGTAAQAIDKFVSGALTASESATVNQKFGAGN
ncbi:MAG: NifB/NifX family molybdenum-iron cluster-binding protein [Candidatus Auribacterota bacterium]